MLPKEKITEINTTWGICGFASSLTACHKDSPLIKEVKPADFPTRLMAEIKTFLKVLEASKSPIYKDIEALTKTFKGFEKFNIPDFIDDINKVAVAPGKPVVLPKGFGIAMTPEAVVKYLEVCWDKKAKLNKGDASGKKGVILGLFDKKGGDLKHWVYKEDDKKVYNWGEVKSLADTLADCKGFDVVDCFIDVP
jgi:hypothetical protein